MTDVIAEFINTHPIAVLTVILPDGTPHGSAMHVASSQDPFCFFFETEDGTRKYTAIKAGQKKAAVVIGCQDGEWKTLQLEGEIEEVTDPHELDETKRIYYTRYPDSKRRESPKTVFLRFLPNWWRFSDFTTTPPSISVSP